MRHVCHTSILIHYDTESGLDANFGAEYQVLFGKFAELSDENLQLIKDKAMSKAQKGWIKM